MVGSTEPSTWYGLFFVLLFVWIGLYLPRGATLAVAPGTVVAFAAPLTRHVPAAEAWTVGVVAVLVYLVVGEALSWAATGLRRSEQVSRQRADALAGVAEQAAQISAVSADAVLPETSRALAELGFRDPRSYAATQDAAELPDVVRTACEQRTSVWRPDPAARNVLVVATPVCAGDEVLGALTVEVDGRGEPGTVEVEVLEIMAAQAGRALAAARQVSRALSEAMTDPLTGLGNRRAAERALQSLRAGDSVAVIDLDHFKQVNDQLGHARGDAVLAEFGSFLSQHVRSVDHVVRVGGEEFLLFMTGTTVDGARRVVDRLRELWWARTPIATFSAGVAGLEDGEPASATVSRADRALYRAKGAGRNRVHAD